MRAYFHDNVPGDCRLPHDSGDTVPEDYVATLGVILRHFPVDESISIDKLNQFAESRNYSHRDEITVSPEAMGAAYEEKITMFFNEHMHEDEEIRYILKGKGYFDVRNLDDKWVRICCEPGDMLVLPSGIYHRFTVDEDNYIHAMRLFQSKPKWTPLNRGSETDRNPHREAYLKQRDS